MTEDGRRVGFEERFRDAFRRATPELGKKTFFAKIAAATDASPSTVEKWGETDGPIPSGEYLIALFDELGPDFEAAARGRALTADEAASSKLAAIKGIIES